MGVVVVRAPPPDPSADGPGLPRGEAGGKGLHTAHTTPHMLCSMGGKIFNLGNTVPDEVSSQINTADEVSSQINLGNTEEEEHCSR